MKSAMVIMGHDQPFYDEGQSLIRYLRDECGLEDVTEIEGWKYKASGMQSAISDHAKRAARDPFLLAYTGHGWHDGWYYGKEDYRTWLVLSYDWLVKPLAERKGPTLVINDTCHAGSLIERVQAPKKLHETCVIAATTPKGNAVGDMLSDIIKSWRRRKAYVPRRREHIKGRAFWERRGGIAHDHHFFPKSA